MAVPKASPINHFCRPGAVAMMGRRSLVAIVVAALVACVPAMGYAAGGFKFTLPLGPKNPSGLILTIDGHGVEANGYRPVAIEVHSRGSKPLPADRQLRVVLQFSKYVSNSSAGVSQIIELPEGSTSVKTTMVVPQSGSWSSVSIETFERGEKLIDLSHARLGWPVTNGWSWTEARPALLFIDSNLPPRAAREAAIERLRSTGSDLSPTYALPDVRPLLSLFPDLENSPGVPGTKVPAVSTGTQISDAVLLSVIAARSRAEMLTPAELPPRWIELSQYDVAVIALADLQLMARSHTTQLAALRDWASTGPTLIVYGAGPTFARLADIERLLELPALAEGGVHEMGGWTAADKSENIGGLRIPFDDTDGAVAVPYRPRTYVKPRAPAATRAAPESSPVPPSIEAMPFVLRPAATGCVVAVAKQQPFPGSPRDWAWLFNSVSRASDGHWKWFRRWGLSLHRTNDDYWKLLIPGVGEAPIISFMLLVSLFAVAIGPVNYWLLGRARRAYLLLLTVPAGATLVTMSLFVFAVASDGFSMRLRVRSFADLDQATGRAAVWSRQSYYAAMAPSQGLVFPDDTTVFPLLHEPSARSSDRTTLLAWDGDQRLRSGFLSSRTATQFMVCRATATKAKLIVTEGPAEGQPANVENRLAAGIRYLLLRDARGDYFAGQSITDGRSKALSKIEVALAEADLAKLADAVRPAEPHGYNPNAFDGNFFLRLGPRYVRTATSDSSAGDPVMASSLLETNLDLAVHPARDGMTPRSYIAIVETSPLVVSGVSRVREEASFHVIRGRY